MHNIHTLFKMVSNTKTFPWVSGRQVFKLALSPSKPIPLLLAGTWTCFWIQNDLSRQSHPKQNLDDCLDPALHILNTVSMMLYQMCGSSPVKQHQLCSMFVCHGEAESDELCPHNLEPGKQLLQDRIVLQLRRTDFCITIAWVWEDSS